MELTHKKILQNMLYYSVLGLTIIASIFFMILLAQKDVSLYQQIVFYVWSAVIVGTMVFDIICTIMLKNKFITGLILFVLSMTLIAMAFIVFFDLSTGFIIPEASMGLFNRLIVLAIGIDILAIITYIVGEFIIQSNLD